MMALTIPEAADMLERRRQIAELLAGYLIPGQDYGNTRGKTDAAQAGTEGAAAWGLLLLGAEKTAELFNLRTEVRTVYRELSPERVVYEQTATIMDQDGQVLATRTGVCSSEEEKYRGRTGWKTESKLKEMGLTTEGRRWEERKAVPAAYRVYEVALPVDDLVQTIMGMASKRAFVAALEAALGISGLWAEQAFLQAVRAAKGGGAPQTAPAPDSRPAPEPAKATLTVAPAGEGTRCSKCAEPVTDGVAKYSQDRYGKILCQKGTCRNGEVMLAKAGGDR